MSEGTRSMTKNVLKVGRRQVKKKKKGKRAILEQQQIPEEVEK